MRFKGLSVLLPLVLSLQAHAKEEMVLTARPGLCIIKDASMATCIVDVQINWQASAEGSFCLHVSTREQPLQCWSNAHSGAFVAQLTSAKDVRYWMQGANSTQELAPITVRILSVAQKQPNRHRRRHAWTWL